MRLEHDRIMILYILFSSMWFLFLKNVDQITDDMIIYYDVTFEDFEMSPVLFLSH